MTYRINRYGGTKVEKTMAAALIAAHDHLASKPPLKAKVERALEMARSAGIVRKEDAMK